MRWMKHNPMYSDIVYAPEEMLEKLDEYTFWSVLKDNIKKCIMSNPQDPNLLVVAGIISFQEWNFG